MKVFKFGGASIKDASSIKNILKIISSYNDDKLIIVVSAMGKTTNALEIVVDNYFNNKPELQSSILDVFNFHSEIMMDLFKKNDPVFFETSKLFEKLKSFIKSNKSPSYSFVYDQIVSLGELLSSNIIHHFLLNNNIDYFYHSSDFDFLFNSVFKFYIFFINIIYEQFSSPKDDFKL
jgi:aspartate kinase